MSEITKLNELLEARKELTRSYNESLVKIDAAIASLDKVACVDEPEFRIGHRLPKATKAEMAKLEAKILAACESCAMSMGAIIAATESPEARVKPLVGKLAKAGALVRNGSLKDSTYRLAMTGDAA